MNSSVSDSFVLQVTGVHRHFGGLVALRAQVDVVAAHAGGVDPRPQREGEGPGAAEETGAHPRDLLLVPPPTGP